MKTLQRKKAVRSFLIEEIVKGSKEEKAAVKFYI